MRFTWNDEKNRINIQRHGIDFEDAKKLFSGNYLEDLDNRKDYGEERMVAIGYMHDQPLIVAYTQPSENIIHLISARAALPHEERKLLINLGVQKESAKSERMSNKRMRLHKKKHEYGEWNE